MTGLSTKDALARRNERKLFARKTGRAFKLVANYANRTRGYYYDVIDAVTGEVVYVSHVYGALYYLVNQVSGPARLVGLGAVTSSWREA